VFDKGLREVKVNGNLSHVSTCIAEVCTSIISVSVVLAFELSESSRSGLEHFSLT
jgi:hypothetical protein